MPKKSFIKRLWMLVRNFGITPKVRMCMGAPPPPFIEFTLDVDLVPEEAFGYDFIREGYYLRVRDKAPEGQMPYDIVYPGYYLDWNCQPGTVYFQVEDRHLEQCQALARAFNFNDATVYHASTVFVCKRDEKLPNNTDDFNGNQWIIDAYQDQLPPNHPWHGTKP